MCDLACKTKIIINGGNASGLLYELCEQVTWARDNNVELPNGEKIVELLNDIEDGVLRAQRLFLESIGYTGPLPQSMKPTHP